MEHNVIGLASDHAGFMIKETIKAILEEKKISYTDYGTWTAESCDYPDFAHALAHGMIRGDVNLGVAACGTGEGMVITLNKYPSIRAGLAWKPEIAHLMRRHNDANVLVLPGRFIDKDTAEQCLDEFLATAFEGGRHQRRVSKIVPTDVKEQIED